MPAPSSYYLNITICGNFNWHIKFLLHNFYSFMDFFSQTESWIDVLFISPRFDYVYHFWGLSKVKKYIKRVLCVFAWCSNLPCGSYCFVYQFGFFMLFPYSKNSDIKLPPPLLPPTAENNFERICISISIFSGKYLMRCVCELCCLFVIFSFSWARRRHCSQMQIPKKSSTTKN